jgi:hypothetical protein
LRSQPRPKKKLQQDGVAITGVGRESNSQFLSTNKIPASGTTSKYTVDVTL